MKYTQICRISKILRSEGEYDADDDDDADAGKLSFLDPLSRLIRLTGSLSHIL